MLISFPHSVSAVTQWQATDSTETTNTLTSAEDVSKNATVVPSPDVVHSLTASLNPTYIVQSGDTVGLIALRMGVDAEALRLLNRIAREDVAKLQIGDALLLPATPSELRLSAESRDPIPEPTATPDTRQTYEVKSGDSLSVIAEQYDVSQDALMKANGIRNANNIYIGQQLVIPEPVAEEETGEEAEDTANEPIAVAQIGPSASGFHYHTVQSGDTLSEIAEAYDSTTLAIFEFNNLPDQQTVYLGLDLRIPYGPPTLPQRTPPVPISGTSFMVSLSRQQCWVFHGKRVHQEWVCSTGYGEWITRIGTFAVKTKEEIAKSSAYRIDMPYWLGLYDVGEFENGIHGLPVSWDDGEKIWGGLIGQPATFGCAMLDDREAEILFDLSYLGMPIHIVQ
ncbi:MAG: LysM peptidoglycan-binding domain-containing protein [Chloroflexota bacterium]